MLYLDELPFGGLLRGCRATRKGIGQSFLPYLSNYWPIARSAGQSQGQIQYRGA